MILLGTELIQHFLAEICWERFLIYAGPAHGRSPRNEMHPEEKPHLPVGASTCA